MKKHKEKASMSEQIQALSDKTFVPLEPDKYDEATEYAIFKEGEEVHRTNSWDEIANLNKSVKGQLWLIIDDFYCAKVE
jgi:hypothetical protein